jgi:hypothetical protein
MPRRPASYEPSVSPSTCTGRSTYRQAWFYIALRGWPFAAATSRAHRLLLAYIATAVAGVVTCILPCGLIGHSPVNGQRHRIGGLILHVSIGRRGPFAGRPRHHRSSGTVTTQNAMFCMA